MAVLGAQSDGRWRATDTYSPILSEVVKIARFMVVHKATAMAEERYSYPITFVSLTLLECG
jgi:hypothetical protein